ncbi:MAG: LytTR family DNA-binding domain-containing protein [Muribaculaceae bacterium]|nr:LytTR family DNA-binding domain-containing protein [Muribaculaceae bacterium]
MMLRCCVIDDEPLASALIAKYISRTPFMEVVGEFDNCHDAMSLILSGGCDVVFLDIQMPGLTGMDFARMIPESSCRIIFTTAYDRYAIDGYRVNALDYLLKPVDYDDFMISATKALRWFESVCRNDKEKEDVSETRPDRIIVRSGYKMHQIRLEDVEVVEGLRDYVRFYISGVQGSVMTLMSMKSIEQTLSPAQFMRVHRSYIINVYKITTIERNKVYVGTHAVPVGDSYRDQLFDYIASHTVMTPAKD